MPGSLSLTVAGYVFVDKRGTLVASDSDGGYGGSIDYTSGQITLTGPSAWAAGGQPDGDSGCRPE